ncbi:MAG: hypothetical protein M3M85_02250, partial [bacterium]|nr:hypothetical protein [bacterium]
PPPPPPRRGLLEQMLHEIDDGGPVDNEYPHHADESTEDECGGNTGVLPQLVGLGFGRHD